MVRPVSEWDESDLLAMVANEVQESLELDYKRSDALAKTDKAKNEISKDVSAFANSAGGRIIYGVVEQGHKPIGLDAGSDPAEITREWLEQVINSTIQQRIPGVRIKAISLSAGGQAFVVDIPRSETGPHQASDKRYYRRFEFQSVPMHDYEVRDVAGRATNPALDLEWSRVRGGIIQQGEREGQIETLVEVLAVNRSAAPALYSAITFYLDKDFDPSFQSGQFATDVISARDYGGTSPAYRYARTLAVPNDHPIYRERPLSLGKVVLHSKQNTIYSVGFTISCPGYTLIRQGMLAIDARANRLHFDWFDDYPPSA